MNIGIDQILLYGGGILAAASALAMVIGFFLFRLKKEKLNTQLEKDYGER